MSVDVLNEPCPLWFAVGGVRVGLSFLLFYTNVRMVLLRFGDVSGCAEWAVPIVICCWWCEFWRWREIRFFCVPAVMAWVLGRWREIRPPPSTNQVRDGYIHFDVVLCQVLKWRFEIAHKYLITVTLASNHTVSVFFSYDMAGILYIISDRHRILSLYKLNIHICITYRDIKVYYTCMYYYIIRFHDFQYKYNVTSNGWNY